jgi:aspartyl-tRNA(Asn)/glutamyl-tRNA(Gln) amidotransferase subunit B
MKIKIGLEIHVALDTTEHKLFSKSKFSFATAPNSTINYFDLAYPGTLPVLNKQAIKLALITCYFLKATVSDYLSFERKHYFYSDLPKGYQLTQRDNPIGKNGYLLINLLSKKIKKICIQQIQLEEDTAKQIYQDNIIKLDFNRCGVGLLEIVTAPDFENAEEVLLFLERLQFLLRYYQISTANLHKGSMRCDVNISLGKKKRNDVS